MPAFQLVVLDIAGTTVRDKGNVAVAFMEAFQHYGIEVPKEDVNKVMGFRKMDAIRILLDKYHPVKHEEKNELIGIIHERFTRNMIGFYEADPELEPLPHAEELFKWLRQSGLKVALDTGFTRPITDTILQRLQWDKKGLVDMVITSDEVPEGRPHPYMIRAMMETLGITDTAAIVKVGDTEVDVEEGRAAGCGLVVSVTTGAYTRQQLEQYHPDAIIDSLAELPSLIQ